MLEGNIWSEVLERLRADLDFEEFRRWFSASAYASDSGEQITVWVPTAEDGRHISLHYADRLRHVLTSLGRADTLIRFVAIGFSDEDDDE